MKIQAPLIAILILLSFANSNAQDTLYFDNDWQETNRNNYAFFRPLPLKKVGDLLLIQDFYKNGNRQMQGYVLASKPNTYVGDVYWYDENGIDESTKQITNPSNTKVLTYYYPDGMPWKKITYDANGRKKNIAVFFKDRTLAQGQCLDYNAFSGTFINQLPDNFYEEARLKSDSDTDTESIRPVAAVKIEAQVAPDKTAAPPVTQFRVLTYWDNGHLAQEDGYGSRNGYNSELISQKIYDRNGKLLKNLQVDRSQDKGRYFSCSYYSKNGLAVQRKDSVSYQGYQREGISRSYALDGTLLAENTYKAGKPFEGTFRIERGIITEFTLTNGQKTGTEVSWSGDKKTVVATGTYKDGLPWEGSFYENEENLCIYSYSQGKLQGTQKVFSNYALTDMIQEYETTEGLKNGYDKLYKNGKLLYTCLYKNDKPVEGVSIQGKNRLTYNKGDLVLKEEFTDDSFAHIIVSSRYADQELQDISYFNFSIEDQKQVVYTGTYKNGKPFHGFFKSKSLIDDIRIIAYYENGILKKEYSFDLIEQLDDYHFYTYNLTTVYEDNRPITGPVYVSPNRNSYLTTYYQDGIPTKLEFNIFAMHYFNRISFIGSADELRITEIQSPIEIRVKMGGSIDSITVYKENQVFIPAVPMLHTTIGTPKSATFYYLENDTVKTYSINLSDMDKDWGGNGFLQGLYLSLQNLKVKTTADIISFYSQAFTQDERKLNDLLKSDLAFPFKEVNFLGRVRYDEQGKISEGVQVNPQKNGNIDVLIIRDNKTIKSHTFTSIADLTANNKAVLTALERALFD